MIQTRLTAAFNIAHPILGAPMAFASGGALAAATTQAGGLGFIGGGYGDVNWLDEQFKHAGNSDFGCGFITWSLANNPQLLERALDKSPRALFLSFGDPAPFAPQIHAAKISLICQIQTLRDAKHAIDIGAQVIVAQGSEAGGHGDTRSTFTLVPEVSDYIAKNAPDVLLVAAGGIIDGRGLAAALMLGADGVLIGSRLLAATEALVHPNMLQALFNATGDDTLRTTIIDIVRNRNWPDRYTISLIKNAFTDMWHNKPVELRGSPSAQTAWNDALTAGNPETANIFAGQGAGLIHKSQSTADIIAEIIADAQRHLKKFP
jgi:nitronate monooxygenase